jgi:hypothetical protein
MLIIFKLFSSYFEMHDYLLETVIDPLYYTALETLGLVF